MTRDIETKVSNLLEEYTLEDLLEQFDITPEEAFITCFNHGLIDEELFKRLFENGE